TDIVVGVIAVGLAGRWVGRRRRPSQQPTNAGCAGERGRRRSARAGGRRPARLGQPVEAPTVEEHWTTPGPVGVGSRRHAVTSYLGRRTENDAEVSEFEPNRKWTMR